MKPVKVIGISAVGGGGKTAVARRLAEVLGDSVALHFDDYDDSNVHPKDLQRWFADGASYDAYETPVFTRHLQTLKSGQSICHPIGGTAVGPASYVMADAAVGSGPLRLGTVYQPDGIHRHATGRRNGPEGPARHQAGGQMDSGRGSSAREG